jgi:hypothetical protein
VRTLPDFPAFNDMHRKVESASAACAKNAKHKNRRKPNQNPVLQRNVVFLP